MIILLPKITTIYFGMFVIAASLLYWLVKKITKH